MNSKVIELGKGRGEATDASAFDVRPLRRSATVSRAALWIIAAIGIFVAAGIAYQRALVVGAELYRRHEQRVISDVLAQGSNDEAKATPKELRLKLAQERDENERLRATIADIYAAVSIER